MDNHEFIIKNGFLLAYEGSGMDVVIPESVTEINGAAFWHCDNLQRVTVPGSVKKIPERLFERNANLQSVILNDGVNEISTGAFKKSSVQIVSIPDSVRKIGTQAFADCEHLQNLKIPAAVLEIDEEAFWGCTSLEAIDVSLENPRYSSEDGVLYNKERTKLLRYPPARRKETFVIPSDVTEIASCAFQGCRYLKHVTIPSSVKPSSHMFAWCDSLECAVLCDGVIKIESCAFARCKNLQSICIPYSMEEIGELSFENCTSLKRVVLPENVKTIGRKAFYGCDLEEVLIPESVQSIGEKAFGYYHGLHWEFRYHLIIRGKKDSVAEQYADANEFRFVWISLDRDLMKRIKTFGRYPQTTEGTDNTPIEWLVLDVQGSRALVISRYGLDAKPYNTECTDVTWETCTLRTWLNDVFLKKAFSTMEQDAILTTEVDNSQSQGSGSWSTNGGRNTQDKVFLLSYAEAKRYYGVTWGNGSTNKKSRVAPTAYAAQQGPFGVFLEKGCKTTDGKKAGSWWLRSPGGEQNGASIVGTQGALRYSGVHHDNIVVRPALWLNLEADVFR